MEFAKELNAALKPNFEFLRLSEVTYDKHNKICYVVFLYPDYIDDINEADRIMISFKIKELLRLNAELIVKFKKSYLETSFIQKDIHTYLLDNHISVGCQIDLDDINVIINQRSIAVEILVPPNLCSYFDENNISQKIEKNINEKYFANTSITILPKEIKDEVLESREKVLDKYYSANESVTPRYKVVIPVKFVGDEITPCPECIKNIDGEKNLVILAGMVENIQKKEYIRKSDKEKIPRHLYTFTLVDFTGEMQVTYFSSKTNEKKLDRIVNGSSLLLMGDIRKNYQSKLTYYPKHISFCTIKPELQVINENTIESKERSEYLYVSPEPFFKIEQSHLFFEEPKYNIEIIQNEYVVFDVETTGLDANSCEIIEIGAVKVKNAKVCEKFSVLIKPHEPISEYITSINGITNEMVENCKFGEDIISDFYLFCKGCILVGYNVGFDYAFIQSLAKKVGLVFENKTFDVLEQAKKNLKLTNYKLITVVKHLGFELDNAHRAYYDAFATAEVFLKLSENNQ